MKYRLKPSEPDIEIVDGPLAPKSYCAGGTYDEIPPGCEERFEPVAETDEGGDEQ